MTISNHDIEKIATLARLAVTTDECDHYRQDLNHNLEWIQQIDTIDTDRVEPLAHPLEMTQRLRDDTVTETDQRDDFQQNAPCADDGFYRVPKVID